MQLQNSISKNKQQTILKSLDFNVVTQNQKNNTSHFQCQYEKQPILKRANTSISQTQQSIQKQQINKQVKVKQERIIEKQDFNRTNVELFLLTNSKGAGLRQVIEKQFNASRHLELLQQQKNKSMYLSSFELIRIPSKINQATLNKLNMLDFPVLAYSLNNLITFSTEILYSQQYCQSIFSKLQLDQLITIIAGNYNLTAYHNFSHAFSLMQLNFKCLEMIPQFKKMFTSEEIFYVYVAGLSHDLNHKGTNNRFEINRNSEMAVLYNYESVLQNMHISTLWKILRQNPELDFLIKTTQPSHARFIITKMILGTDMVNHFKNTSMLQKKRLSNQLYVNQSNDKMFLMQQLFHSCDLGNVTLEFQSYMTWSALLSYQFNQQYRLECLYNIEKSNNLKYKNIKIFYEDQIGFVGNVVYPLWRELGLYFTQLRVFTQKIQKNLLLLNQKLQSERKNKTQIYKE